MITETKSRRIGDAAENGPKVLIVDDLDLNRAFVAGVLADLCHPLVAADGEEALRVALAEQPDMILLDVRMPGLGGFETCRQLKENPLTASIAVVFLTSAIDEADEEIGLNLGALDYITKPFHTPILRARVRNLLRAQAQHAQLSRLSQLDGLTGIANRRSFDESLLLGWRRLARMGEPLALLLVDVDAFKPYNDNYGHQAGDEILKRIAACIADCARRDGDLTARYGGEEFACILPQAGAAGAIKAAEDLRARVERLGIVHAFSPVGPRVTVSIGCCSMVPTLEIGPESLIAEADRRLYRAKRGGRNRVVGD